MIERLPQTPKTSIESEVRRKYYERLLAEQTAANLFPTSNDRLSLISRSESSYRSVRIGYVSDPRQSKSDKFDYGDSRNVDIGHKLHLNVAPKDVIEVASYLQTAGYTHKYLSGGSVGQGKIFTIHIGSKTLADQLARQLSSDLNDVLFRPVAQEDVEYAPNVAGRFAERGQVFDAHGNGLRGVPMLAADVDDPKTISGENANNPRWLRQAFERSYSRLAESYGSYFYGK